MNTITSSSNFSHSNNPICDSMPSVTNFFSQPIVQTSSSNLLPTHSHSIQSANNHKQKKIYTLPKFSGSPEDWQIFYESFITSTQEFEYSELHNIMRLKESLKGNARDTAESLLIYSRNVNSIIETLSQMFGRPEQLIKSQIQKVRPLPSVQETDLNSITNLANKVVNMTIFLESVGGDYNLSNPLLLSELIAKLPVSKRLKWAETCLNLNRMPTIKDF